MDLPEKTPFPKDPREEKSVHDHHRTFLASKKNFPGRWWIQKPYKDQENQIHHRNLSSVHPIFFCKAKFCTGAGRCMLSFSKIERGEKTPTPKISALLRKRPVLLSANFVLTKDRKWPYYGHFCGEMHREGSCSKAAGVLSKVQMLNLVLGVGVFFPSSNKRPLFPNPILNRRIRLFSDECSGP